IANNMGLEEFQQQYCSQPENITCSKKYTSVLSNVILYFIYMIAIVLTTIGNLLVTISISHFKQLHTPTNFLVLSMAVTDFLTGLFVMPIEMARTLENCWYFGSVLCMAEEFIYTGLTSISIVHLLFLAVDRYYAVYYPLLYNTKMTTNRACLFVLISWLWPILEYTLYFTIIDILHSSKNDCYQLCRFLMDLIFKLTDFIFSFLMPCLVMLVLYGKIFIIVKQHAKAIENVKEQKPTEKKNVNRYQNKQHKATKTIAIVIFTFILCLLPVYIIIIMELFNVYPKILYDIFNAIAFLNCGFNPVIYGLFYPWSLAI
uniref:G-protein coupled receptors family 1 profile domain-containing protein n=1 Tax=Erpetoichthys calabaricus TaxID=27687 RepID=A0A8C4T5F6_ERPCA